MKIITLILLCCVYCLQLYSVDIPETFIRNSVLRYQQKHQVPGIAVVVFFEGQAHFYPFGVISLQSRKPVDEHTIFELGSITKSFTAIALAAEVLKGTVKLNDPAADYLHGLQHVASPFAQVTLEQLVTHTGGFPHQVKQRERNNYPDVVRYLQRWHPVHPPGTHYQYSNYGFGLLGLALENATQQSYMNLLKQDILTPLKMDRTFLIAPQDLHKDYAQGYAKNGTLAPRSPVTLLHAAGALRSNAADMAKLLGACLNLPGTPQQITQAIKLTEKGNFKVSENKTQVMSWMKTQMPGYTLYAKNGAVSGFSTFMGYIPEFKTGIVILANKNVSNTALGQRILRQLAAKSNFKRN